jgi:transglutaminase-like putative cysteine protease
MKPRLAGQYSGGGSGYGLPVTRPPIQPEPPASRDAWAEGDERSAVARAVDRMRPDEGWASLPLVLVLAGIMAWSISDARWILGRDNLTSFLIWIAIAAAAWGYVSSRLPMAPWMAHAIGSVIGAFVIIEVVGSVLPGSASTPWGWFHATADSVAQAYLDLTWRHQTSTLQYGHFCLILGIFVWGTAQAASYDIFGYHRGVNGVLLVAVVLVANMALTANNQYLALVLFSATALVLLLLAHAADERSGWLRHRIWRGRDLQSPHMQGGLAFASMAVLGALVLTMVASSAPLASVARDPGGQLQNAFSWLGGYLPNGGTSRYQPPADYGDSIDIVSSFQEGPNDAFTVRVSTGLESFHWRLISYDTFRTTGWSVGTSHSDQVVGGGTLDQGTQDLVTASTVGRTQVSFTVHVQDTSLKHLIVANEPDTVSTGTKRTLIGGGNDSSNVSSWTTDATDYTVAALVPNEDPAGSGLTAWRLQHAGTTYPTGLLDRYSQGANLVGADGQALLADITAWAHSQGNAFDNEYDVTYAIQQYLLSDRFTYTTNITAEMSQCTGKSTVDCFAVIKRGFCEQYATTMTMLVRMAGYPARYVQGYLPGKPAENTLIEQITSQLKHAWVEVYFPTYGWIPFDPTGGSVGQPTELPAGVAVSPSPISNGSFNPFGTTKPRPDVSPAVGAAGSGSGDLPGGLLIPTAVGGFGALALCLLWFRRPRPLEKPETVYRNIVKLASRLGYKPSPTQTVYEYTGMLSDLVPAARDPLGEVATATVEVTYGRRQLGTPRLISLSEAQRRVRQALLRLVFRVPRPRGRKPRPGGMGKVG